MVCLQQEQQQAFKRQQEVLLRAQKAEEERARSEAALHALQQHNLHLQQQQQEAQRLAGLGRDRQQRLQEEQEQQEAQTRHVIDSYLLELSQICLHAAVRVVGQLYLALCLAAKMLLIIFTRILILEQLNANVIEI